MISEKELRKSLKRIVDEIQDETDDFDHTIDIVVENFNKMLKNSFKADSNFLIKRK